MIRGECCLACFIDDLAGALALLDVDEKTRCRILVEALNGVAEGFPKRLPPSYTITRLHRILKRETGIAVPFKELRETCNRVGAAVAKRVEGELRGRPEAERFHGLVLWSIAGNHLDFRTVGTGYGRYAIPFGDIQVTEISCHARGASFIFPGTRTVLDIGGQDTKGIRIDDRGEIVDFSMNDKCAAGTGRFLEAMARSMEIPIGEMENHYFGDGDPCTITAMCSVFAESEVINLINDGVEMSRIVKGLLLSLANRVASLTKRMGVVEDVVMTGGVAKNQGVQEAIEKKLKIRMKRFDGADPQIAGALGAALIAADFAQGKAEAA